MIVDIKKFEDFESINQEEKELSLFIDFSSYPLSIVKPLFEKIKSIHEDEHKLEVIIQTVGRNFSDEDIVAFSSLESALLMIHVPLYFDGGHNDYYSLKELVKMDKALDGVINKIKSSSLSPLEKFFSVYLYLMKFKYKAEETNEDEAFPTNVYLSRDIISVINNGYIVCEGYSRLMEYLLDNLGILSFKQLLTSNGGKHMNNLVYIEDEKYQVKGLYYVDSCWDTSGDYLIFCLLPLSDVAKLKTDIVIDTSFLPFYHVRNYKMLDDYYLIYAPETSDQQFLDTIKKHNLANDVDLAYKKSIKLFLNRRKAAIDSLISIFKEMNINSDFYLPIGNLPYGASLNFFVAMLILSLDNAPIVKHQIIEIQHFRELGFDQMTSEKRPYFMGDLMLSSRHDIINDLYEYLVSIKEYPYEKENLSFEHLLQVLWDSEQHLSPEMSFSLETLLSLQRAIMLEKMEKVAYQYPHGEAIPLDVYRQALTEAFKLEDDYNEEAAKLRIEALIIDSITFSKCYFSEASNCFFNEKAPSIDDALNDDESGVAALAVGEDK